MDGGASGRMNVVWGGVATIRAVSMRMSRTFWRRTRARAGFPAGSQLWVLIATKRGGRDGGRCWHVSAYNQQDACGRTHGARAPPPVPRGIVFIGHEEAQSGTEKDQDGAHGECERETPES